MTHCKECKWWQRNRFIGITGKCLLSRGNDAPMFVLVNEGASVSFTAVYTKSDFGCIKAEPKETNDLETPRS